MPEDTIVVSGNATTGEGSAQVSLHPLPLLNISEHYTRSRIRSGGDANLKVIGALIGVQQGREVEIANSFELALSANGAEVNHQFLSDRQNQFKQVFPTFEFLGWYTVGASPTPLDLSIHTQLLAYNESPLFLQLSPSSINAPGPGAAKGHNLPLDIYESVVDIVDGKSVNRFVRIAGEEGGYRIETGEAERIAVESASRPAVATSSNTHAGADSSESVLIAGLMTQRNAIQMLHTRISVILQYLDEVRQGNIRADHETLRQISSLMASITAEDGDCAGQVANDKQEGLAAEMSIETDDVLLTGMLSQITRNLDMINSLVDKFSVQQTKEGRDAGFGHDGAFGDAYGARPRRAGKPGGSGRSRQAEMPGFGF